MSRARAKKLLKWTGVVLGVSVAACLVTGLVLHEPRPEGTPGPEADAMARALEDAAHVAAWRETGAVRWTFAGRTTHLWDRAEERIRVRWGDVEVVMRLSDRSAFQARRSGSTVNGDEAKELRDEAYARFINDSFWLNPLAKLFDEGVTRSVVELEDGGRGLLISYSSGGLTPGDAYLWIPGQDGLPREWRMWVSIIPIGGVSTTWEGWETLATGAKISTLHQGGPLHLKLTDVAGEATLEELLDGDDDPFAALGEP